MEKKKKYLLIIGIFIVLLSVVGVTYAYWTLNLQQTGENDLTSSCFKVKLLEENDPILLQKAYPILDSDAESLIPYTFTLKNECEAIAKYQINLEILEDTTLDTKYVKYMLNEVNGTKVGKFLTDSVDPTITEPKIATEAYKLKTGYLESKEEKHYELRIYLNGELTTDDKDAMNKTFLSKISITASYAKAKPKTLEETILALEKKEDDSGDTGLYKVEHTNANITYTKDPLYNQRLQATEYRYAGIEPNNYVDVGDKYTNDVYKIFLKWPEPIFITKEEDILKIEEQAKLSLSQTEINPDPNDVFFQVYLKQNEEQKYIIEFQSTDSISDPSVVPTGMLFTSREECESASSDMKNNGFYVITNECTVPESYYELHTLVVIEQPEITQEEYNSESECLKDLEVVNAMDDGSDSLSYVCEKLHQAGDPIYWRIIGLVNTPEGQRVKLIRDESIGDFSWDTSASNVNSGLGVNEWSQSDLMKLLNPGYETNKDQICTYNDEEESTCNDEMDLVNNSLYWDGEIGKCYTGQGNTATECNFTNIKMPDNLKSMIDTITWNTGSYDEFYTEENTILKFYEDERSSNTGDTCKSSGENSCNDNVDRTITWKGKVGLIYTSDYGYATSGGRDTTRTSCLNIDLHDWYDNEDCYNNDWLRFYDASTIFSYSDIGSHYIFETIYVYSEGITGRPITWMTSVYPSVYLKSDVFVKQGDGSKSNAYILEA